MKKLMEDLRLQNELKIPSGDWEAKLDKIKCNLFNGQRIMFYYADDINFICQNECCSIEEAKEILRQNAPFSGLIIAQPDVELRGELEWDDCVVVIDKYPVEKCYIECEWVALGRLVDNEELVEII